MYNIRAYVFVIHLLKLQYEKLGGECLPHEHELLIDAATSGIQPFIQAIEQMFYSHLEEALVGAIDICLQLSEYTFFFYHSEDVFKGLDLLLELVCICCPSHAGKAGIRLKEARMKAAAYFSSRR